jgi:DNA-directed RNA polymerase subunit RPC12/RpoP
MHLECETCGASLTVDAAQRSAICPYCASPSVIERPPVAGRPSPAFTLGFTIGREVARSAVQRWLGTRGIFTQSSVRAASIDSIRGVYVPAFIYSALSRSSYSAEIGENYTETQTYTVTNAQGKTETRTRTVTRTEYRHLEGAHAAYLMDVIVTASRGVSNAELEAIEPFDLRALRRYSPLLISGWIAEDPTLSMVECIALARGEALAKVGRILGQFMPGNSHRSLVHRTLLERETADLLHVPIWVLAARHDPKKPLLRILVNGQTGKVIGNAPLSWVKILIAVLAALALIGLIVAIASLVGDGGGARR